MTIVGEAYVSIKAKDEVTPALKGVGSNIENEVGGGASRGASKFGAAFSGLSGVLKGALGPAFGPIAEIGEHLEGLGEHLKGMKENVGKSLTGIGTTATVLGTALTMMGDKGKVASGQLESSITNAGGKYADYKEETEKTIKSQEKFGYTAVETQQALTLLVTRTGNVKGSYENMTLATNIAANKHISLAAAAGIVAKVMNGNTKVLKQYGIGTDAVNKATDTAELRSKRAAKAKLLEADATMKGQIADLKDKDAKIKATLASGGSANASMKLAAVMRAERIATLQTELAGTKDKATRAKITAEIDKEKKAKQNVTATTAQEGVARQKLKDILAKDKEARDKLTEGLKSNKEKEKDLTAELKNGVSASEKGKAATELLAAKMKGQAAVAADTFTGKMKAVKARMEDFTEEVAGKVGPALQKFGPMVAGVGLVLQSGLIGKVGEFGKKAGGMISGMTKIMNVTKIWTAIQWVLDAAMTPMVIIPVLIAAVVAAFVIAYVKIKPFHKLVDEIAHAMVEGFKWAFKTVIAGFHWFTSEFGKLWKDAGNIIKGAWNIAVNIFKKWNAVPQEIRNLWSTIVGFFGRLWSSVVRALGSFVTSVVNFFHNLWTRARTIVTTLISDVVHFFAQLPGKIISALAGLANAVGGAISRGFSGVRRLVSGFFSSAGQWLYNAGKNAITGFVNGAKAVWGTISGIFARIGNAVKSAIGNAASWLSNAGRSVIHGFISGVTAVWGEISGYIHQIGGKVKGVLGDAGSWLWNTGRDIINGLVRGITSLPGAIMSALVNLIPGPLRKFAHSLGIGSPSKLFRDEIGRWIPAGIAEGIRDNADMVAKAIMGIPTGAKGTKIGAPMRHVATVSTQGLNPNEFGGDNQGTRVINLFPHATIDFGKEHPGSVVQRLENAVMASRL